MVQPQEWYQCFVCCPYSNTSLARRYAQEHGPPRHGDGNATPKVEGARILDERFSDNSLDFFVMLLSIMAVAGNPGQANYSAATAFLQGLAQQRCARRLAGSTIGIRAVYGVVSVTGAELEGDFNAIRFMFDSVEEHELYTLFAEVVVSGRQALGQKQWKTVLDISDVELTRHSRVRSRAER